MGLNEHMDAQKAAPVSSLLEVLAELDKPMEEMDTDRIDQQTGSVSECGVRTLPAYDQAMRVAWRKARKNNIHAAGKRLLKRTALVAASLILVAATTFGAANAFRWNGFMRIFHLSEGTLTFQSPAKEYPPTGSGTQNGEMIPPPPVENEDTQTKETSIRSAEELYALDTPGDKAFRPMLEKYALSGGTLIEDVFGSMLHLSLKGSGGESVYVQIVTYDASNADNMSAGVTFEIDEGSQQTVRLGSDAVIVSTNGDINAVEWVLPMGYCHIFGKTGKEDLLEIARMLIDAGLKPV